MAEPEGPGENGGLSAHSPNATQYTSRYLPNLNMEIFELNEANAPPSEASEASSSARRSRPSLRAKVQALLSALSGTPHVEMAGEDDVVFRLDPVRPAKRRRMQSGFDFSDPNANRPTEPPRPLVNMMPQGSAYGEGARNDPAYTNQWFLNDWQRRNAGMQAYDIDAAGGWAIYRPQLSPIIGIIDSGIQTDHPDLRRNLWRNEGEVAGNGVDDDGNGFVDDAYGYNFADKRGAPTDSAGHGTHVAGIVAAVANNSLGVSGVCPNCRLMGLKFMDAQGEGYWSDAIAAIEYALQNGVAVTCNSYGTYTPHDGLRQAVTRAGQKGMLFVAAAGNDGKNNDLTPKYPGGFGLPNVIAVASITRSGALGSFSNYGRTNTHIASPGEEIYSTSLQGGYRYDQGTSMSAPIVAAVAAMVWASQPSQTYAEVKSKVLNAATKVPGLPVLAGGTVNLKNALLLVNAQVAQQQALQTPTAPPAQVQTPVQAGGGGGVATTAHPAPQVSCAYADPCHWNADCRDRPGQNGAPPSIECVCKAGFRGDGWQSCEDINECAATPPPCNQNAACKNTAGGFECTCNVGFTGDGVTKCEQVSVCGVWNPCLPGLADCKGVGPLGLPTCTCKPGYTGDGTKFCNDIDECTTYNGGCDHFCTNSRGGFACSCKAGFQLSENKKTCIDIDECATNNGGCSQVCINEPGSHRCGCRSGFLLAPDGYTCSDANECLTNNGGCDQRCVNTRGSFYCACFDGFAFADRPAPPANATEANDSSDQLDTPADTAALYVPPACVDKDECAAGGTGAEMCEQLCVNTPGGFHCACRAGFELAPDNTTCVDVDECLAVPGSPGRCSHLCTNLEGSFKCTCPVGYRLAEDNATCRDVDECAEAEADGTTLCEHECVNRAGRYECRCRQGYTVKEDRRGCGDINECLADNGGCAHTCKDTNGGFVCSCDAGYKLGRDKKSCDDVDECQTANGGCQGGCNNTAGSFLCTCPDGYRLGSDGKSCDDVDECADPATHMCEQTCSNTPGSYTCSCQEGYSLNADGMSCDDIDECVDFTPGGPADPAAPGPRCAERCINTAGGYACGCRAGYRLAADGVACEDVDECAAAKSPCAKNAVCSNLDGSFECECAAGFVGDGHGACVDVDECVEQQPCNRHATCTNTPGSFTCVCKQGYDGDGVQTCRRVALAGMPQLSSMGGGRV